MKEMFYHLQTVNYVSQRLPLSKFSALFYPKKWNFMTRRKFTVYSFIIILLKKLHSNFLCSHIAQLVEAGRGDLNIK